MPCFRPIPTKLEAPYKRGTDWIRPPPVLHPPLGTANGALPCGRCVGCQQQRATQWAQRCQHEASRWSSNVFLTLTYDDEHLPHAGYLEPFALTNFIKRLRKRVADRTPDIATDSGATPRYFGCGEYGERNGRPHYHILLFNCGFTSRRRSRKDLYEADVLDGLWPAGGHTFGPATPAAANYIAQYTLKKQRANPGLGPDQGYNGEAYVDADGVYHPKPAPFLRMSLKPAIGSAWLEKFKNDLQLGYLVSGGHRHAIPRTYREKLKLSDPALAEEISIRSAMHTERNLQSTIENSHPDRLSAAETIKQRLKQLNTKRLI